jgi:hypothetical protein
MRSVGQTAGAVADFALSGIPYVRIVATIFRFQNATFAVAFGARNHRCILLLQVTSDGRSNRHTSPIPPVISLASLFKRNNSAAFINRLSDGKINPIIITASSRDLSGDFVEFGGVHYASLILYEKVF